MVQNNHTMGHRGLALGLALGLASGHPCSHFGDEIGAPCCIRSCDAF